jgi:hypothetical protein
MSKPIILVSCKNGIIGHFFKPACRNFVRVVKRRIKVLAVFAVAAAFMQQQVCWSQVQVTPPSQASDNGYTWTAFSAGPDGTPFSTNSVDVKGTLNPSFQWFPTWFYWNTFTPPIGIGFPTGSGAGTAIMTNAGISSMASLHSGTLSSNTISGIVGEAFGGGGYFEATFQYNPSNTVHTNGWPAWWADAMEHLKSGEGTNHSQFWWYYDTIGYSNSTGFVHYPETDFFEDNIQQGVYYGGTMIDWYGTYTNLGGGVTNFSSVESPWPDKTLKYPANTVFNVSHKYGWLWVPATVRSNGTATFYFDDVPYSTQVISWEQYQGQAPYTNLVNQSTNPWTWSILDQEHLGIILNTPTNEPMIITSVNVWQANNHWDIHTGTLYDPLYDMSETYSSTNIGISKPNAGTPAVDYNGDTAFGQRSTTNSPGSFVYCVTNISSFTARVYYYSDSSLTNATFAISSTGLAGSWSSVTTTNTTPYGTSGGWSYTEFSNSNSISAGYNYLQVTLKGHTANAWDLAVGQIRIN